MNKSYWQKGVYQYMMYYCDNLYIILKKYHIGVNSNYKMEKEEKPKRKRCPKGTHYNKKTDNCDPVKKKEEEPRPSSLQEEMLSLSKPSPSPKSKMTTELPSKPLQTLKLESPKEKKISQTSQTSKTQKKSKSTSPKSPKSVSRKRESPKTSKSSHMKKKTKSFDETKKIAKLETMEVKHQLTSLFQKTKDGHIRYMCIDYPTIEHAYQAQKYKCSNKPEFAVKLFSVETTKFKTEEDARKAGEPEEMKKYGADFDEMCWNNMLRDLLDKT